MPVLAKMPNYVAASIALSFGGFLNGYDTGTVGSQIHMPQFVGSLGAASALATGITVSVFMLTGIVPALCAGQLADQHGRLRVMLPGVALFVAGVALQAAAASRAQFVAGRALAGVGHGVFYPLVTLYIAEVAPTRRRGRLTAMPQFMATLGVCVGYFCCYGTSGLASSLAWRLPCLVAGVVGVALMLSCLMLPESPRWLMLKGRPADANRALVLLDFDMDEARRDFLNTVQEQPNLSRYQSFLMLFRRGYRLRTFLSLFFLSMVQLSGIDAITYYAPRLFDQAGITSTDSSLVASGVSSIVMFAVSIPGFMLADKWDRRTSAISGGLGLGAIMMLMGSLYAAGAVTPQGAARWVVVVCVYLFGIVFCATWGIGAKIYASEIQPAHTRGVGNSVGMAFSLFCNWFVAFITPLLLDASAFGAYFLFAGLVLFTVAVLAISMPETRGRSLESIQLDFRHPASTGVSTLLHRVGLRRRTALPPRAASANASNEGIEMGTRGDDATSEHAGNASAVSVGGPGHSLRIDLTTS
ncbi:hypothetical protein S40293_01115 [Stachybotrys chartarum IBT 40293]|nr:hypothetical protein S40293_01115 [Stachybotrys chartarum IBT 40293]